MHGPAELALDGSTRMALSGNPFGSTPAGAIPRVVHCTLQYLVK